MRSSKSEREWSVCLLAAVPSASQVLSLSLSLSLPSSFTLSLSLLCHNELPCTSVAYFLGAAIRFHRAATSHVANYGAKPRAVCLAA